MLGPPMSKKRRLRIPPPVTLMQPDGSPVYRADDSKVPVVRTFREFVLDRTTDILFVTADKGATPQTHPFDANCMFDQHLAIEAASKEPGAESLLDDDVWQRLQRSTKGGSYNAAIAYLFRDYVLAIMNAPLEE